MKQPLKSKRHPLLLYRRVVDQRWPGTLFLAILLAAFWGWNLFATHPLAEFEKSIWILLAAIMSFFYSLFTYLSRYLAYVRAHKDHIRLVSPFYQVRISYRRFMRVYPKDLHSLYPPQQIKAAQESFLAPFYGHTLVVIELSKYPVSKLILTLFFTKETFLPDTTGLVILVSDWMAFSTELDTLWGNWQQAQKEQRKLPGSYR